MRSPLFVATLLLFAASGCLDFDGAYSAYCADSGVCSAGGGAGGSGGGSGGGVGGGVGGGSGGGSGGGAGGGTGGGSGGGSGGGGGSASGFDAGADCAVGLCLRAAYFGPNAFFTLYGQSDSFLVASGRSGTFHRFDGTALTQMPTSFFGAPATFIREVVGAGPSSLRAAGASSNTFVWNGTAWTEEVVNPPSLSTFYSLWWRSGSEHLASEYNYNLIKLVGTSWQTVGTTPNYIHSIHGQPGGLGIGVGGTSGGEAIIFHEQSDGGFKRVDSGTEYTLRRVFVMSDGGAVAVGYYNTMVQYSGGAWRPEQRPLGRDSGTGNDLYSVVVAPNGEVWVAGEYGTVGRRRVDGGWVEYATLLGSRPDFYSMQFIAPDHVWLAGGIDYSFSSGEYDGGVLMLHRAEP